MTHHKLRRTLLILLTACLCTLAHAQSPAITPNPDGSVTIDASRLTNIIQLQAPWRFSPADNPHFADLGYDDSTWPLVRPGKDRVFAKEHAPNVPGIEYWARLHIHILNASGPLAMTFQVRYAIPYEVFANGKQIGATKGFAEHKTYRITPFAIELPQTRDCVLAIHFVSLGNPGFHYFSIEQFNMGQSEAMRDEVYRTQHQEFNREWLSILVLSALFLAVVPIGITLFIAQRSQLEYLWLSVFCLFLGAFFFGSVARNTGLTQSNRPSYYVLVYCTAFALIASLEIAVSLARFKPRALIRIFQASLLLNPVFPSLGFSSVWNAVLVIQCVVWPGLILYILIGAWRRGRKECGFLMFPITALPLSLLVVQVLENHPEKFGDTPHVQFLGIGFQIYQLLSVLFLIALLLVVLYRFIRVSKEEEAAASEFEAARTVQQLLIPSTSPATPGFLVESVYLPARQVGGDFFLILPASGTSQSQLLDPSLLVVMGDVSGKGLQAAMVVSTIIGGLRMQLSRQPAEVLAHLNRVLTGHVSGFTTCCAILLHPDGSALLANAGNPSPYVDGEELATSPGLPLGLIPDVTYEETGFTLAPGSRLTFVSDGVVEATSFPRKELFGFDRTRAISQQSAAVIAEAACAFGNGAPQADDITVLTICLA